MRDTDLFSSIWRPVRGFEPSSFQKPLLDGTRNREFECASFLNGQGMDSVRTENLHQSLKRTDQVFHTLR